VIRALLIVLILGGCSGPLKLLTGGGPNVAANVQAGQVNNQTLGENSTISQETGDVQTSSFRQSSDRNQVTSDQVETIVIHQGLPFWALILIAFLIPSPTQWAVSQAEKWLLRSKRL
jgi:hypothetical protein